MDLQFVESQAALGTEAGFKVTLKALDELTETKCSKLLLEVRDNLNNNTVPLYSYLDVRILFTQAHISNHTILIEFL